MVQTQSEYHKGHEQVVDPRLDGVQICKRKRFLSLDVDHKDPHQNYKNRSINQAIYFKIQGVDFGKKAHGKKYEEVLAYDWEKQMLRILEKHKQLGIYKYSLHPSSYWVVDRELKMLIIFPYHNTENKITVKDHHLVSHQLNVKNELMS